MKFCLFIFTIIIISNNAISPKNIFKFNLKSSIKFKASFNTLVDKISDMNNIDENILSEFSFGLHKLHPIDIAILFTFFSVIQNNKDSDLDKISIYSQQKKYVRHILTIVFILFVKNVESVT
jgi:hypothetical protein